MHIVASEHNCYPKQASSAKTNMHNSITAYVSTPASSPLPGAGGVMRTSPGRKRACESSRASDRPRVKPRVPKRRPAARVAAPPPATILNPVTFPKVEALDNETLLLDAMVAAPNKTQGVSHRSDIEDDDLELRRRRCIVMARNTELHLLAKRKDLEACLSHLNAMRVEGLAPDKYSYSIVLTCCARLRAFDVALDLYNRMQLDAVPADDYILTNLITVASNAKPLRLDMCMRLFAATRNPSGYMCNVMIDAYAREGRVSDCLAIYNYMNLRGMEADKYTVSALVKAYVKSDRLDDAFQMLREMHAQGQELSDAAFGQVMDAFGKRGLMGKAVQVFDLMTLCGVAPTQITYNILIGACATKGLTARAFEIFEEMKAASSFVGDRYTLHSLMSCCLKSRDTPRVMQLYRMIKKGPFMCNQVSYRYALTAAGQSMDIDAVMEVFEDMERQHVKPREDTAAALVAAAIRCSDLHLALNSFAEYQRRQKTEARVLVFFDEVKMALQEFEEGEEGRINDFECTAVVVEELERSWRKGKQT